MKSKEEIKFRLEELKEESRQIRKNQELSIQEIYKLLKIINTQIETLKWTLNETY